MYLLSISPAWKAQPEGARAAAVNINSTPPYVRLKRLKRKPLRKTGARK
jgi:hypothetical protein